MQLTESSVREIKQEPGITGMLRHIDYCAGVCYNRHGYSKDSKEFVRRLYKMGHMRPLEFGTVNLKLEFSDDETCLAIVHSDWSITDAEDMDIDYAKVTTNFRVICEIFDDFDKAIEFIEPRWTDEQFHERPTFGFILGRGIGDEFRTHVSLSSLMKSTRYVNATKTGEINFIKPYWYGVDENRDRLFEAGLESAENYYSDAIALGLKPQEARELLPMATETELYQCGFWGYYDSGWGRFLLMRLDEKTAHPDAVKLAKELKVLMNL